MAALPAHVSDQSRRHTSGSPLGAAWGDPAIVLRCGVGAPEGYEPGSPCQRVNGVDWFVPEDQIEDQGSDVLLTTIGRSPAVEVAVPSDYRPPNAVMVDLADAITRLERRGIIVLLSGVAPDHDDVLRSLGSASVLRAAGRILPDTPTAIAHARRLLSLPG